MHPCRLIGSEFSWDYGRCPLGDKLVHGVVADIPHVARESPSYGNRGGFCALASCHHFAIAIAQMLLSGPGSIFGVGEARDAFRCRCWVSRGGNRYDQALSTIRRRNVELPVLVIDPVTRRSPLLCSLGVKPRYDINAPAVGNRRRSPASAIREPAMTLSMQRSERSSSTTGFNVDGLTSRSRSRSRSSRTSRWQVSAICAAGVSILRALSQS